MAIDEGLFLVPDIQNESGGEQAPKPLSSFLRARIAWHTDTPPPTFGELSLQDAAEAAMAWQSNRNWAEWYAFTWHDEATRGWTREIHGLFGTAGELMLSNIEAAVEIAITKLVVALPPESSDENVPRVNRAAQWRALRFFAEAQANNLVIFGHTVANMVLRTLALQVGFTPDRVYGIDTDRFQSGSEENSAWCSLNKGLIPELRRVARSLPVSADPLLESLGRLRTILVTVSGLRGVQYHRWRGESPGVTGINFLTDPNEVVENGIVTRTLRWQTDYVEGEKIVDDLVEASDLALRAVAAWMPEFLETWTQFFMACKAVDEKAAERLWRAPPHEPEASPWYRKLLRCWRDRR